MYLDDLAAGFSFETGERQITEAEILGFAREWDPQPFHIDPEAAKATIYGGLIASGFHTILIAFRLTLDAGIFNEASMGSPGIEKLEWSKPVRPGDVLRVRGEVLEVVASASRPDRGRALMRYLVFNQDGEVARYTTIHILKRRA
jgi:acyl dehydratase